MPPSRSSSSASGLLPNSDWPEIVDRLLGSGSTDQGMAARATMWLQIERYVVHVARLPIGPLADDPDLRRDLALRVLQKLEKDDYQHVRTWRERQRTRRARGSWWTLISTVTRSLAIDLARRNKQNLARRGEHYIWARVIPVDPAVFEDSQRSAMAKALQFLDTAGADDRLGYITALAEATGCDLSEADVAAPDGEPRERTERPTRQR
jgi:hypothetical protein